MAGAGLRSREDWRTPGIVLGLVAVALAVRLAGINLRLLPDEGYTWLVASAPSAGAFLHRLAVYENTPPLYYLLLTPLPLDAEWLIRLPSLIGGVAMVAMLYWIVRPALGRGTAILAALALAIAPYAVATSDFGRGFTLADAGLLGAFWGAVRIAEGASARWWWVYGASSVLAIYSEYDAATTLVPLAAGLLFLAPRHRRLRTLALAALPALTLLPWLPELQRSLHNLDVTKTGGGYVTVTPASIRDQVVAVFYGETGHRLVSAARTVALLVLLATLAVGGLAIHRRGARARPLLVLLAFTGIGTFALHALAPAVGVGIFNVSYLTFLVPIGCVALAAAVAAIPIRIAVPVACVGLIAVGAGLIVKRLHKASDINPPAIQTVLEASRVRTVLTNSAAVYYYFRGRHAILDRPFGLGPGMQSTCSACARPIAVIDDARVGSGARPGPGETTRVGHYVVRVLGVGGG